MSKKSKPVAKGTKTTKTTKNGNGKKRSSGTVII